MTLVVACRPVTEAISEADGFGFVDEIAGRFAQDAFLLENISRFYALSNKPEAALVTARKAQELNHANPTLTRLPADIYRICRKWKTAAQEYRRQHDPLTC